jgi:hypothetical protein
MWRRAGVRVSQVRQPLELRCPQGRTVQTRQFWQESHHPSWRPDPDPHGRLAGGSADTRSAEKVNDRKRKTQIGCNANPIQWS